ncbi:hypothetical protein ACS0TY_012353 [Phlomoides rotata]
MKQISVVSLLFALVLLQGSQVCLAVICHETAIMVHGCRNAECSDICKLEHGDKARGHCTGVGNNCECTWSAKSCNPQ